MGASSGALTDHDVFTPLGKNVSRTPLSRQNWAQAATTAELVPSSTVRANWLPSPGSRVTMPCGAGTCALTGCVMSARAVSRLVAAAARTPIAMARNIVRLSSCDTA